MTEGFERASMDSIARAAGVSKQTVYSHFQNKDELFQNCIQGKIRQYQLAIDTSAHESLEAGLAALADGYLRLLSDPRVVAMWRLVITESSEHPHVASMFYESGPGATMASLERFLEGHGNELSTTEYRRAAHTFMALVAGHYQTRILLNVMDGVPDDERVRQVERSTRQFMALYGN